MMHTLNLLAVHSNAKGSIQGALFSNNAIPPDENSVSYNELGSLLTVGNVRETLTPDYVAPLSTVI